MRKLLNDRKEIDKILRNGANNARKIAEPVLKQVKELETLTKKFDFKNGIPKKVDGPVELVHFENKMPLTAEMEYFIDNLNNKNLKTANVHQALDVIKILVEASGQIN